LVSFLIFSREYILLLAFRRVRGFIIQAFLSFTSLADFGFRTFNYYTKLILICKEKKVLICIIPDFVYNMTYLLKEDK